MKYDGMSVSARWRKFYSSKGVAFATVSYFVPSLCNGLVRMTTVPSS